MATQLDYAVAKGGSIAIVFSNDCCGLVSVR